MERRRGQVPNASDPDTDLFHSVLSDVVPLNPGDTVVPTARAEQPVREEAGESGSEAGREQPAPAPRRTAPAFVTEHRAGRVPGLDRRTAMRLKRGQIGVDARLDLHGMTQARARTALDRFVAEGIRNGHRCLLVITGKGDRDRPDPVIRPGNPGRDPTSHQLGVLRRMVPRWLSEPPLASHVVAVAAASKALGGSGAFCILLRKRRQP